MKRALPFALPLLVFLGLALLFWSRLGEDPQALPTALAGQPLPAQSLPSLDGLATVDVGALRGPLLLNVWATWCPSCYQEHAYLLALQQQGVRIVGINYKDDNTAARAFLRERGNPFEQVIDDPAGSLGIELGVYGAPETFIVDAQGRILHRHAGVLDAQVFARDFAPRLAGAGGSAP